MFTIKFPLAEVQTWARDYLLKSRPVDLIHEARIETVTALEVRERGWFTKPELIEVCHWKSPRSQPLVAKNPEEFIQAITHTALSNPDERLRIKVLTLLEGVSWPSASVLLHFGYQNIYPVLDYRALWSLGIETPPAYEFDFWWDYTLVCRQLAHDAGVSMRTLDRALWQYSKINQP